MRRGMRLHNAGCWPRRLCGALCGGGRLFALCGYGAGLGCARLDRMAAPCCTVVMGYTVEMGTATA